MTDQTNPTVPQSNAIPAKPMKRIFKIGAYRIAEDAATANLSNEQIKKLLASQYPEIANATIRETVSGDLLVVEYLARPGIKG